MLSALCWANLSVVKANEGLLTGPQFGYTWGVAQILKVHESTGLPTWTAAVSCKLCKSRIQITHDDLVQKQVLEKDGDSWGTTSWFSRLFFECPACHEWSRVDVEIASWWPTPPMHRGHVQAAIERGKTSGPVGENIR
jgi:hypothetical protein